MSKYPQNKDDFKAFVEQKEKAAGYVRPIVFAIATIPQNLDIKSMKIEDIEFLVTNHEGSYGTAAIIRKIMSFAGSFIWPTTARNVFQMLKYFEPFSGETGHANIVALKAAFELHKMHMTRKGESFRKPVIIMLEKETDFEEHPLAIRLWQVLAEQEKLKA